MTQHVSAVPKNYGYSASNGKSTVKVRGITLTTRASEKVNMCAIQTTIGKVMQDVLHGTCSTLEAADNHQIVVPYPHSIVREGNATNSILAKDLKTRYKAVIGKRLMVASLINSGEVSDEANPYEKLPFGTCRA